MDKTDFHIQFFQTTGRNEWFALLSKGTESQPIDHLYQCFIENDSIRWNYQLPFLPKISGPIHAEPLDAHRFLMGTSDAPNPFFVLDTEKKNLSPFPLSSLNVSYILRDRDGNFWFSTEEGIYQCARAFFESYQLGIGNNDNLWNAIKDLQGSVWFSSYTHGFWRADAQGNLHRAKTMRNHKYFPVKEGYMESCMDNRGRVFQNCSQGLAVFDPQQGDPNRLDIIGDGVSLAVYHDTENGKTWFGGHTGGGSFLNVLDANGTVSAYLLDTRNIISISRDGNGKLRIGTFYGEAWLDEENGKIVSDTTQHAYDGVISMALDEKGILWKGTTHGLFTEDRQGNERHISDGVVNFVVHYKNRYMIYGVKDKLYLLDLPAYHRDSTVSIRSFGLYDGFDVLECGQNGASIDPDGYFWIAGGNRAIRFLPEQIMKIPPLQARAPYLAAIYNANKNSEWTKILIDANDLSGAIRLKNKDNYLRFDLLQASVTAPDQLIFRYQLKGYNEQWTTSRERSLIFQNLPFGKLCLEVQSSFDNGQEWSESVFSPQITIENPFLLTPPGLALIIAGILGLSVLLIYYTRKISIRKGEEMRKIDQMKHRAVQAKFIPHFTANVLNSISQLTSKNPDLAQKYISKFYDFSNQTLQNSDELCCTIREELIYSLRYLELEKLRFPEKLEYDVSVAPEVDIEKMIPTMILQTFCENALKHGLRPKEEGGKITMNVYSEAGYVVLAVEDTGVGREEAQKNSAKGTKEGLNIVQQQLDIFNKSQKKRAYFKIVDLFDDDGRASGTRLRFWK